VVTRQYSARLGRNALLGFDNQGRLLHDIALGTSTPFRVAVDSDSGAVWVTIFRGRGLKYTAAGKPDGGRRGPALAAGVRPGSGAVWGARGEEVLKRDRTGRVVVRASHKAKTSQAWVLCY